MAEPSTPLDVTVVTGMSGAGRSAAADVLEDLGFFVIDNLPPALIPKVAELGRGREGASRFALVVDTRAGEYLPDLESALAELRESGARTRVLACSTRARADSSLAGASGTAPAGSWSTS